MKPPESRICDARLSEEVYTPINPSEEEVACAEYGIGSGDVRVARIEPDRLLDVRNARFQVAEEIQRLAKPKKCARVIAVERDRPNRDAEGNRVCFQHCLLWRSGFL